MDTLPPNLLPHHGGLYYFPDFLSAEKAIYYFDYFRHAIPWQQQAIRIFGKEVMQPRLTAAFADPGVDYGYSGIRLRALDWDEKLLSIRRKAEEMCGCNFNTALLNYYRNGSDSMGWHRDNEKELGPQPSVASVSLGAIRQFQLRDHAGKKERITLNPASGSLILMNGECQHYWEHALPKSKKIELPRLNITFRKVIV